MKTSTNLVLMAAVIGGGLLITGCASTPEEQQDKMNDQMEKVEAKIEDLPAANTTAAWENERNDVLADLRDLRNSIDNRLSDTNAKLATTGLKPSERSAELAMQAELVREKTRVETVITNVENAEEGTWISVKEDSRKTTEEVKGWWARLKDNIDKKTDSDKDQDGH